MHDRLWNHLEALRTLYGLEESIERAGIYLCEVVARARTTFFVGCGGSAALASHLAAEYVVQFCRRRRALPAVGITDAAILTAAANDLGWAQMLARPILALGQRGDALVAFSTSGRSPPVLEAVLAARRVEMGVVALTGDVPNELATMADLAVCVPSRNTAHVQECHLVIGHLWCEMIDDAEWVSPSAVR